METLRAWLKANHKTLEWLAAEIGRSRNSIKKWHRVPAELVVAVEGVTGVPRQQLRPDIFGPKAAPEQDTPTADRRGAP